MSTRRRIGKYGESLVYNQYYPYLYIYMYKYMFIIFYGILYIYTQYDETSWDISWHTICHTIWNMMVYLYLYLYIYIIIYIHTLRYSGERRKLWHQLWQFPYYILLHCIDDIEWAASRSNDSVCPQRNVDFVIASYGSLVESWIT